MSVVMSSHEQRMAAAPTFAVREAHALVRDLATPDLRRYWADMLLSAAGGWAGVLLLSTAGPGRWWVLATYPVVMLLMYRAAVFIHEVVHFRTRAGFTAFRRGWNALVGIPLLIPTFMYEMHSEHHSKRLYGTDGDGEYIPFARLSRRAVVKVLYPVPVLPLLGPWRFGVLAPVSWLVPSTRDYVYTRASSMTLDLGYQGRAPKPGAQRRSWLCQEAAAFVLVWTVVVTTVIGLLPWQVVVAWAAVVLGALTLDAVRTLGAHRYIGNDDTMSVVEQMLDTVNYPSRPWLTELWGPVGLRLHALHHLVPSLPYHALPEAHRRLVAALPGDSAYRLTESPGLVASLVDLWRTAGTYTPAGAATQIARDAAGTVTPSPATGSSPVADGPARTPSG